eukprot:6201456-Pleurochrysis_carterae.AAC.1
MDGLLNHLARGYIVMSEPVSAPTAAPTQVRRVMLSPKQQQLLTCNSLGLVRQQLAECAFGAACVQTQQDAEIASEPDTAAPACAMPAVLQVAAAP